MIGTQSTVRDVMTTDVVTVREDEPFKQIVGRFLERRVGAAPVVDPENRVVGVVSASDLLLKEDDIAAVADAPRQRGNPLGRGHRRKAGGAVARDVMTTPALTVADSATLGEAARLMESEHITHLPVVEEQSGHLRGIVSRSDLLSVFLRPDELIERQIIAELEAAGLESGPRRVSVDVRDGIVTLRGDVEDSRSAGLVVRAVLGIEGVVKVVDQLGHVTPPAS